MLGIDQRGMEFDCILYRSRDLWSDLYLSFFFYRKVIDANQREAWVTNETYWELRKDPGFSKVEIPVLW